MTLLPQTLLAVALALPTMAAARAQDKADGRELLIRPNPKAEWDSSIRDVEKVLRSAASELWKHFPERRLAPILVEPKGGPIVLYKRGPNGEYRVRLDTGSTYWAQYAFQFAHEFCHILCGYTEGEQSNKWFEESLCEMASLFVLHRMADTWKTDPPYPHWKDFAKHLREYADKRIADTALPPGQSLATWYRENEDALRKSPTDRKKNRVVAGILLPMFEERPEHWEAVTWLNTIRSKKPRSFKQYLTDWHDQCPARHKAFVRQIASKFDIGLQAD
ncbi:MAG TPA: hypothetical protein VM238_07215 [Phycisphaerae bacterium]|nr:hypothetical protein [Phycisphaerae bacterium]